MKYFAHSAWTSMPTTESYPYKTRTIVPRLTDQFLSTIVFSTRIALAFPAADSIASASGLRASTCSLAHSTFR
ncbi:hypothetical protein CC80DRAFT_156377 [Byssothecium circinans]|uniref:Uncharacterized protein n=1 Tax=Byssothecium circinans TaxID=147558 RepID=A0A6A5UBC0_9PLEO|nr:hypothetical protein CC80DRAFT_156377 [Byssothecium circinans]